jgi:CelD/BcsL family acetyltransferase involved in cellulose biosynthesis
VRGEGFAFGQDASIYSVGGMTGAIGDLEGGVASALPAVEEWEELADRVGAPPFLRPGWIGAWLGAFGRGELETIEVRREGELAALMPMVRRGRRLRSPVNWHTPLFGPLGVDRAARRQVVAQAFERSQTVVDLDLLDGDPLELDSIASAAHEADRVTLARDVAHSPYIRLEADFAEYERSLSRNRRKSLRRRRRRLEEEGRVRFEVHDGRTELDRLLAETFAVEAAGWKGRRGSAISSSPETARFYTEVARWAADRGWLRLALLRLDGRPIASDFAIEHGGAWYTLKAGYDEEFRSFGPGALLLAEEIAHCCEHPGVSRIELLGQEDAFKSSWTALSAPRTRIRSFGKTPAGLLSWARATSWQLARPFLRRVRGRRGGKGLVLGPGAPFALEGWAVLAGSAQLPL